MLLGDGARVVALVDPLGAACARPARPWRAPDRRPLRRRAQRAPGRVELDRDEPVARAIRVSSHYPFDQVNPRLDFDRDAARGFRLDLPAGAYGGLGAGRDPRGAPGALRRRAGTDDDPPLRRDYRARFGPTTGDRVRVADSDLWMRVEDNRQAQATSRSGATARPSARGWHSGTPQPGRGSSTPSSPARSWSIPRSASSRPTSASRTAGSSASGAPAARRSATASTSTLARTPSRSSPTA